MNGEWVSRTLNFRELPSDWAEIEASQCADPWLGSCPNLHALRRMAILADIGAVRLLQSLRGRDGEKEQQILAQAQARHEAAERAKESARTALAYLACTNRLHESFSSPPACPPRKL